MSNRTYFLGGNTDKGFFSCYDSFCRAEGGNFLWIIKSGPGSGKSTLMRRVAAEAAARGFAAETVLCSSDPDSLDGVFVPALHLGVVDGTAPHVLEPRCIGADSLYLDLSPYYDLAALRNRSEALSALNGAYRAHYARAYRSLAAIPCPLPPDEIPPDALRRFDAAVCCRGVKRLENLTDAQTVTREALQAILPEAGIVYLHPLFPTLAEGAELPDGTKYRAEITVPDSEEAICELAMAKALHDELEAAYRPYIDFAGVSARGEKLLKSIFN